MKLSTVMLICSMIIGISIPNLSRCDELIERDSISNDVVTLFQSENFQKLESLADSYRRSRERTSSGLWRLTLFYAGIAESFNTHYRDDEYWTAVENVARKWVEHYPKSATARLSYAQMLLNHGMSYRGGGYANTVAPQDWKPFNEFTQKARAYLEAYKDIASVDPRWYEMMEIVAYRQGWAQADFSKLLDEGLRRHPYFYQIYFAAIDYFAPKWGGSAAAIEKFAKSSFARTQSVEGYGMYARIYWYASETEYGDELFTESEVRWSVMKRGIDDVLAKYPDSWNIENFAKFSCMAGDKEKAAELTDRVKTQPLMQVWGGISNFQQCKTWAHN